MRKPSLNTAHSICHRQALAWQTQPRDTRWRMLRATDHAVCLHQGAEHATLTDREPLALECGLRSARASGVPGVAEDIPFEHVTKLVSLPAPSKVTS